MAKGKKSVVSSEKARSMEDIEKDPRFAHTARDPRFKPNYKQKKVKIDSRFKSMLQDKEFNIKFLDKRGRPINSSTKEDLRRLYQYESDSEEEKDSSEEEKSEAEESNGEESSGREEEQDENDDEDDAESSETGDEREASEEREGEEKDEEAEEDADDSTSKGESSDEDFPDLTTEDAPDYARGVGVVESSDDDQASEDEDDEEEEEQEEEGILDHNWNEPDRNAPEAEEITSRLALCNMDWDRIKARDLYVLFTSFVPQDGAVQSVTIYPSELGREKMAEEEKLGPREFRERDDKGDDRRTGKLNPAKLRQYQLNRLAYYYAVIVCDSKETANKLYEECDSMEYEKSACRVDLRFIPEGMTFEETPKDSCTGVSDLSKFKPSTFTTTALCQAKVQVTWDETSIERLTKTMQKKFTEEDLGSNKFDELIASSSEDSSEEETSKRPRKKKNKKDVKTYRKLLGLEDDKVVKEKDSDSQTSGDESEQDEDEEMLFSAKIGSGSEDEEEVEGDSEDEEEQKLKTVKTKSRKMEKMKKKDKKNSKEKQNGHNQNSDVSADEEEVEGEMQYTWQPSANPKMLKTQAKKLTPWEEYQQKKKDKKKEKKRERKQQRLREQGIEDTTDLGFDDEFFNDEPTEEPTKKKKKERKKKRQQEENKEESEADRKDRASLALLMKDEDNDHNHFSLMQIMKEESEGKKKKGKKRKQAETEAMDSFEMKLDHSRFGSLYTDPNMHIDPNAPEFKKTKGMMTLMEEVSKKRKTVRDAL